jgi:hypothetical protein
VAFPTAYEEIMSLDPSRHDELPHATHAVPLAIVSRIFERNIKTSGEQIVGTVIFYSLQSSFPGFLLPFHWYGASASFKVPFYAKRQTYDLKQTTFFTLVGFVLRSLGSLEEHAELSG